jgi:nitrite reductase/ring-hydroxylating ferredoxin subunit
MAAEQQSAGGVFVDVCGWEDLARSKVKVVAAGGRTIALFLDEGRVHALDNRCPHMGFPLHRGTVRNGILTCHWHHAKFDLAGGCTFDPFADDVPAFRVHVQDGRVLVDPTLDEADRTSRWLHKMDEGLRQQIPLVLAKSMIGLEAGDQPGEVLRRAALFGLRNRAAGWSTGLSVLTAMANLLPSLAKEDRPLALYHGLSDVGASTAGQAPAFPLDALRTEESRPERFREWFRRSVEMRAGAGAERALRTAIASGATPAAVAEMVFAACTDHRYIDGGHTLDFANKAFELLDHIGWEHAQDVLPSLVPHLAGAQRMEETSLWREPIDIAGLLDGAEKELPGAMAAGASRAVSWKGHRDLAERILESPPQEAVETILATLREGAPLQEISATVAYAAARRMAHFHTSNEFFDWDTVHHAFTYANAVDRAVRRSPSPLLGRGVLDGAMAVYLERFLNLPKQPLPRPGGAAGGAELLASFDRQGQVDESAEVLAGLFAQHGTGAAVRALGAALLREDAGFHQYQSLEAAARLAGQFGGGPLAEHVLIGACRFIAAHAPTARAARQTFEVAARLHRGEALYGEE